MFVMLVYILPLFGFCSVQGLNSQHKVENTWFSNSFSISAHTCTSHDYNILINMILTDKTCNNKKEVWYDVTWWASSLGTLLLNRFTICGFWTSFRFFVWSIKVNVYSRYTRLKIQNSKSNLTSSVYRF